ncbi:ABC transporter ATPase [Sphingobacterium psychroaquaticum]|uniref:ABC transporter ATPase n=1 Tax=Sphingobacterium psychroaquaticum TaxID=561061 RepID=A0A1X7K0W8_9SPHI|nr:ABC transporter ATPase [Sphingobacterium psychroaquaticum]SMG34276.1 hypothetical protein SAMN05660862_2327 [Sphingobacterium psychroaquaticum]
MKRLWIYQSDRLLTDLECVQVSEILGDFVKQWTAHGNQLLGSFEIRYNLFIFLIVDEEQAMVTGCSVDKSVHLLKKIENELSIQLFDRLKIAYKHQDGNLRVVPSTVFEELVKSGALNEDTIVFNNMLTHADDIDLKWEVPLRDSWHAKVYL